jgi:hypothetical protein
LKLDFYLIFTTGSHVSASHLFSPAAPRWRAAPPSAVPAGAAPLQVAAAQPARAAPAPRAPAPRQLALLPRRFSSAPELLLLFSRPLLPSAALPGSAPPLRHSHRRASTPSQLAPAHRPFSSRLASSPVFSLPLCSPKSAARSTVRATAPCRQPSRSPTRLLRFAPHRSFSLLCVAHAPAPTRAGASAARLNSAFPAAARHPAHPGSSPASPPHPPAQ